MPSDYSRRTRYSERKTRRPKGGRDVYGEREDSGRWARCGYCGFINDVQKTAHGGATSLPGVHPVDFTPTIYDVVYTSPLGVDLAGTDYVLPQADQAGAARKVRLNFKPDVTMYCVFCGSPSWYKG